MIGGPLLHERVARTRIAVPGGAFVFGSGCVVAPERVLTARHVLARKGETPTVGQRCEVQAWPCVGPVWSVGTVLWIGEDENVDVAVLAVPGLLPDVPDVPWGRLAGSEPVPWNATGFPVASLEGAGRAAEQVSGSLGPASNESTGGLALTCSSRRPRALKDGSAWAGLSGAAVFVEARLIGVVVKDSARFDDSLIGLRVSAFHEDVGLLAALGRPALVLDPVGTGSRAHIRSLSASACRDILSPAFRLALARGIFGTKWSTGPRPFSCWSDSIPIGCLSPQRTRTPPLVEEFLLHEQPHRIGRGAAQVVTTIGSRHEYCGHSYGHADSLDSHFRGVVIDRKLGVRGPMLREPGRDGFFNLDYVRS